MASYRARDARGLPGSGHGSVTDSVVILTPEPPYPLRGGGAFRIASLIHYFARFTAVDLIFISDSGQAAELPKGLVRTQTVIPLPPCIPPVTGH